VIPLSELRTAAYCPRQLYYRRRDDDWSVPGHVADVRELTRRYPALVDADDATLAALPVRVAPAEYRRRLRWLRATGHEPSDDGAPPAETAVGGESDRWRSLVDPLDRDVVVEGRDCRGVVHRLLADPMRPSLVSTGTPPERGVWASQSVWAVGAAKALAYERGEAIETATVEYPAHGVVRRVRITGERRARYRETVRSVREMDGPPPREASDAKCAACAYAEECGVRTRTLRSLLGVD
jgi:CRISPR-associated exonuclease Cas4